MHRAAAFFTFESNGVDVWLMQFDIALYATQFFEFGLGADDVYFAAVGTYPNGQRRAPISFTRQAPIDDVFEEVAHASRPYAGRNPIDGRVVFDELLLYGGHLYKPRRTGVIQKRSVAPPAEGIAVLVHKFFKEQSPGFQIL